MSGVPGPPGFGEPRGGIPSFVAMYNRFRSLTVLLNLVVSLLINLNLQLEALVP